MTNNLTTSKAIAFIVVVVGPWCDLLFHSIAACVPLRVSTILCHRGGVIGSCSSRRSSVARRMEIQS